MEDDIKNIVDGLNEIPAQIRYFILVRTIKELYAALPAAKKALIDSIALAEKDIQDYISNSDYSPFLN